MILPIQEDGTAIFLQAFAKYILKFNDNEFLFDNWKSKIKPVIEFLINYSFFSKEPNEYFKKFDKDFLGFNASNLIMPSFDIWEQYYGIFTYTISQVLCAYDAAINLAEIYEDFDLISKIKDAKSKLYEALILNLTDGRSGKFLKGIHLKDKAVIKNTEVDSSAVSIWKNNIIGILDPKVTATMNEIISNLTVRGDIGGISRKENDNYLKISEKNNPWVLSTLWVSQYYFLINDIEKGKELLYWVIRHTDYTGLMAEQVNPQDGFSLSVKPLTWSHAEFINTINLICSLN